MADLAALQRRLDLVEDDNRAMREQLAALLRDSATHARLIRDFATSARPSTTYIVPDGESFEWRVETRGDPTRTRRLRMLAQSRSGLDEDSQVSRGSSRRPLILVFDGRYRARDIPPPPGDARVVHISQYIAIVPEPTGKTVYDALRDLREAWPGWSASFRANRASHEALEFVEWMAANRRDERECLEREVHLFMIRKHIDHDGPDAAQLRRSFGIA